ncbi:MAG: adenosylcobinamide-GDP ribazoletransferase, partial [Candidatus Altarchaeaceae archaeon]
YITYNEVTIGFLIFLMIFFSLSLLLSIFANKSFFYFFKFFIILPILFFALYIFSIYISKKIGGLTGDIYGAINEISEILFLIFCIIFIKFFNI